MIAGDRRERAHAVGAKLGEWIAKRAQDAMGSAANEVTLLDDAGAHPLPRMEKLELARRLVGEIAQRLPRS